MPKNYYSIERRRLNLLAAQERHAAQERAQSIADKQERISNALLLIAACALLVFFT